MKFISALILSLFSLTALAADDSRWVEIGKPEGSVVYLDDSSVITEDGFAGYKILVVYAVPIVTADNTTILSGIYTVEYNCETTQGRLQRVLLIDDNGEEHKLKEDWFAADNSSIAIEAVYAVKQRVCFHPHLGSPQRPK